MTMTTAASYRTSRGRRRAVRADRRLRPGLRRRAPRGARFLLGCAAPRGGRGTATRLAAAPVAQQGSPRRGCTDARCRHARGAARSWAYRRRGRRPRRRGLGGRELVSDDLTVSRDGAVLTVTFNRPERHNAMTYEMYDGLFTRLRNRRRRRRRQGARAAGCRWPSLRVGNGHHELSRLPLRCRRHRLRAAHRARRESARGRQHSDRRGGRQATASAAGSRLPRSATCASRRCRAASACRSRARSATASR